MRKSYLLGCMLLTLSAAQARELPVDPTVPLSRAKTAATAVVEARPPVFVVSYLRSGHTPRAVVNGRQVGVGDSVEGARVVAITQRGVRLRTASGALRWVGIERKGFSKIKRDN